MPVSRTRSPWRRSEGCRSYPPACRLPSRRMRPFGAWSSMPPRAFWRGPRRARRRPASRWRSPAPARAFPPAQATLEVLALDVAHGEVQLALHHRLRRRWARRWDGRAPRPAGTPRGNAHGSRVLGQSRREQLERHRPLERQIVGAVDDAHAAAADFLLEPVAGDLSADGHPLPAGPRRRLGPSRSQAPSCSAAGRPA